MEIEALLMAILRLNSLLLKLSNKIFDSFLLIAKNEEEGKNARPKKKMDWDEHSRRLNDYLSDKFYTKKIKYEY